MSNKYGIPEEDLDRIRKRDINCVYCHKQMISPGAVGRRGDWATIEHLNHRQDWNSVESYIVAGKPVPEIVAICCGTCNSSRGSKKLSDWFKTSYCVQRKIDILTVTEPVRKYIQEVENRL